MRQRLFFILLSLFVLPAAAHTEEVIQTFDVMVPAKVRQQLMSLTVKEEAPRAGLNKKGLLYERIQDYFRLRFLREMQEKEAAEGGGLMVPSRSTDRYQLGCRNLLAKGGWLQKVINACRHDDPIERMNRRMNLAKGRKVQDILDKQGYDQDTDVMLTVKGTLNTGGDKLIAIKPKEASVSVGSFSLGTGALGALNTVRGAAQGSTSGTSAKPSMPVGSNESVMKGVSAWTKSITNPNSDEDEGGSSGASADNSPPDNPSDPTTQCNLSIGGDCDNATLGNVECSRAILGEDRTPLGPSPIADVSPGGAQPDPLPGSDSGSAREGCSNQEVSVKVDQCEKEDTTMDQGLTDESCEDSNNLIAIISTVDGIVAKLKIRPIDPPRGDL